MIVLFQFWLSAYFSDACHFIVFIKNHLEAPENTILGNKLTEVMRWYLHPPAVLGLHNHGLGVPLVIMQKQLGADGEAESNLLMRSLHCRNER